MPLIRSYPEPTSSNPVTQLPSHQVTKSPSNQVTELIEAIRELHSVDYNEDASQWDMVDALNRLYELAGIEIVKIVETEAKATRRRRNNALNVGRINQAISNLQAIANLGACSNEPAIEEMAANTANVLNSILQQQGIEK